MRELHTHTFGLGQKKNEHQYYNKPTSIDVAMHLSNMYMRKVMIVILMATPIKTCPQKGQIKKKKKKNHDMRMSTIRIFELTNYDIDMD